MKGNDKLVLWDLDGTLMHCGADGTVALNRTFEQLYGEGEAFSKAGIGSAMDSVILDRIMINIKREKSELDQVIDTYIRNLKDVLEKDRTKRVLPGIKEIVEKIEASDHCFNALLTSNLRIGAETKLKSVGLSGYFHVGGFGDDYGEKWDAAVTGIKEAERHFSVSFEKENIFIIGDSPYDVEAAKRLGLSSIGVATGWRSYEEMEAEKPDFLFYDLSNVEEIYRILDL